MHMRRSQAREGLFEPTPASSDDESGWLMSYLDVLTLLITLFVLLLSLAPQDASIVPNQQSGGGEQPQSAGLATGSVSTAEGPNLVGGGLLPRHEGLKPKRDGLEPQNASGVFEDLDVEGVSMAEGTEGITLRIDNNLLFASGQATLTEAGGDVIKGLVPTLEGFGGQISVEGHTDNVPIATAEFPSNWELSTARAIAVLRHLIDAGLEKDRMRAIGYADTQPLESNDTPEGRAANRRVELLVKETAEPSGA